MLTDISIINYIFLIISSAFLIKHTFLLLSARRHVVDYIYMVFFIFYVLPIFLEEFKGRPTYALFFSKFDIITSDFITTLIYNILMLFFQFILYFKFKNRKVMDIKVSRINLNLTLTIILYLVIYLPIILTLFFNEREVFLVYGGISLRNVENQSFYMDIVNSTNLSVLGIGFLSINNNYSLKKVVKFIPILFFNLWINGKRNALVFILLVLTYILINNKTLFIQAKLLIIISLTSIVVLFSQYYMDNIKGFENPQSEDEKYAMFRIDYGRDHDLKMAIYYEIYNEFPPILEYRGQSMLFVATFYIPRIVWSEKPLTYTAYFTSALLDVPPDFQHFGMTTGIFDEFIVNFSFFGFFIAIWLILFLIKKASLINNTFFYLITLMAVALLLTNDIKSYIPIYIIWFILYRYIKNLNKRQYIKSRSIFKFNGIT